MMADAVAPHLLPADDPLRLMVELYAFYGWSQVRIGKELGYSGGWVSHLLGRWEAQRPDGRGDWRPWLPLAPLRRGAPKDIPDSVRDRIARAVSTRRPYPKREPSAVRYLRVLELREAGKTLSEIARLLGVCRERVRQLEQRGRRERDRAVLPPAAVAG